MEYTLKIYETRNGTEPLTEWLNGLKDQKARIALRMRLDRMRLGNFGYCEAVGEGVSEMKIDLGPGIQGLFWNDRENHRAVALRGRQENAKQRHPACFRVF